jgi:hypothetical protein
MIRNIFIAWRSNSGERRYIIARIQRNANGILFEYMPDFDKAKKEGLDFFFGFKDEKKLNPHEIYNLLSLRVISKDRPDRNEFLKFWEAEGIEDTFDLLGLTQGKSPTDNFEFLADFLTEDTKKLTFVTDLAGLTHLQLKSGLIKKGEILSYKYEKNNEYDNKAIAVYKGDIKVGYIKQIHNKVFDMKRKLKLTVKAIDENGVTKQIYIKVEK